MTYTKDTIGTVELNTFVDAVAGIYSEKDSMRSLWDVWLHATHHAASIGEEVRKEKPGEDLLEEIADFAMWLFTFVGKIYGSVNPTIDEHLYNRFEENMIRTDMTFSQIMWNKYPYMCPVCFWHRNQEGIAKTSVEFAKKCDCMIYEVENRDQSAKKIHVDALRKYAEDNIIRMPSNVDEWQEMFKNIFEVNLRHIDLVDIGFHLLEEVGEVSDAMVRMYTYKDANGERPSPDLFHWRQKMLEEEIADVASWLFTLVNNLSFIPEIVDAFQKYLYKSQPYNIEKEVKLSKIIWNRYGNEDMKDFYCPYCKERKCSCPIVLIQNDSDYKQIIEFEV
jgi:NTP pyrophosphatase (non-canonical NTP hydrolase)